MDGGERGVVCAGSWCQFVCVVAWKTWFITCSVVFVVGLKIVLFMFHIFVVIFFF